MNKVDVKYNPYLPELTVLKNNKPLSKYSSIMAFRHKPFTDWCSRFFDRINSEVNDNYELTFTGTEFENEIFQKLAADNDACKRYDYLPIDNPKDVYSRLSDLERMDGNLARTDLKVGLWAEDNKYVYGLLDLLKETGEYDEIEKGVIVSEEIPLVRTIITRVDFAEDLIESDIAIALSPGDVTEDEYNHLQRLGKTVFLISLSGKEGFDGKKLNVFCFYCRGEDVTERIASIIEGAELPIILSDLEYRLQKDYERGSLSLSPNEKEKLDLICNVGKVYRMIMPEKTFVGRTFDILVESIPRTEHKENYILYSRKGLFKIYELKAEATGSGEDIIELYVEDNPLPVAQCDVSITEEKFITEIMFERAEYNIPIDERVSLGYQYSPENAVNIAELKWITGNPEIVEIDKGNVIGRTPGTANIIVSTKEAKASIKVNVLPHVKDIQVDAGALTMKIGDQKEWKYSLIPDYNGEEIIECYESGSEIIRSSNDAVAFYRGGYIVAEKRGNATIYITIPDHPTVKAECRVEVK